MPHKVSITNDIAILIYGPCISPHDHFGPAPAPPPIYVPAGVAAEIPVPMFWPPGNAIGQNKFATKVRHKGMPITQDAHDCGYLIPHVQIAPSIANVLTLAKHIPFSSRKNMFASSTVIMQGKGVASNTLLSGTPMLYCAFPVSIPLAGSPTSLFNTVQFDMTLGDLVWGFVGIGVAMAIDFVMNKGATGPANPGHLMKEVIKEQLKEGVKGEVIKAGLGGLYGLGKMAVTDGPASATVGVGSAYLGVKRDDQGDYSVDAQFGTPEQDDADLSWNPTQWGKPL